MSDRAAAFADVLFGLVLSSYRVLVIVFSLRGGTLGEVVDALSGLSL